MEGPIIIKKPHKKGDRLIAKGSPTAFYTVM